MRNNYVVILSIQFVVVLCFLVYGFVQKAEAEVQRQMAQANAIEAAKNAEIARSNFRLAEEQRMRADSLQRVIDKLMNLRGK